MTSNPLMAAVDEAGRKSRHRARIAGLGSPHLDRVPADYAEGLAIYRRMIGAHHAAVQALDLVAACEVQQAARALVEAMTGEDPRLYLRHPEGAWQRLIDDTAAPGGAVPMWGQSGRFVVTLEIAAGLLPHRCEVDVTWHGMLESCHVSPFPGFEARAVDRGKPFVSDTGYRSFLGCHVEIPAGATTADCARAVLEEHVARELRGRLVPIDPRWGRAA